MQISKEKRDRLKKKRVLKSIQDLATRLILSSYIEGDQNFTTEELAEFLTCSTEQALEVASFLKDKGTLNQANRHWYPSASHIRAKSPSVASTHLKPETILDHSNSHVCERCGVRVFGKSTKWKMKHRRKDCDTNFVRKILEL